VKTSTREYLALPVHELENRLRAAQDELATLGFQLATRKMSNYARLKILRKEIARLKFFIQVNREAE
jgi:ribosomal protein L29